LAKVGGAFLPFLVSCSFSPSDTQSRRQHNNLSARPPSRNFPNLPATAKYLLLDTLCTNLLVLNPSIHNLVTSTKDSTEDGGAEGYAALLQSHRNALKIYVLFLHEICAAEEKEAPAAAVERAAAGPTGGRVRLQLLGKVTC
jgi:hypothetical protein